MPAQLCRESSSLSVSTRRRESAQFVQRTLGTLRESLGRRQPATGRGHACCFLTKVDPFFLTQKFQAASHALRRCGLLLPTCVMQRGVYMCVRHINELCQNGWTDCEPVWGTDSQDSAAMRPFAKLLRMLVLFQRVLDEFCWNYAAKFTKFLQDCFYYYVTRAGYSACAIHLF